jgi:hypothetical protein
MVYALEDMYNVRRACGTVLGGEGRPSAAVCDGMAWHAGLSVTGAPQASVQLRLSAKECTSVQVASVQSITLPLPRRLPALVGFGNKADRGAEAESHLTISRVRRLLPLGVPSRDQSFASGCVARIAITYSIRVHILSFFSTQFTTRTPHL